MLTLHRRLVDQDRVAAAQLADLLLPYLTWKLAGLARRVGDAQVVGDAVDWSVWRYLDDPNRFDPSRGKLLPYLLMDIRRDVANAAKRRAREVVDSETVELRLPAGNNDVEEEVLDKLDPFDRPAAVIAAARRALQEFSETDRALAQLVAEKVRPTAPYAALLGIEHLPLDAQRATVKRHKDRIAKKLERLGAQLV